MAVEWVISEQIEFVVVYLLVYSQFPILGYEFFELRLHIVFSLGQRYIFLPTFRFDAIP